MSAYSAPPSVIELPETPQPIVSAPEPQTGLANLYKEVYHTVRRPTKLHVGGYRELKTLENNRIERLRSSYNNLPKMGYAFTAKNFYVFSNESFTDYTLLARIPISEKNKERIDKLIREIGDGAYDD